MNSFANQFDDFGTGLRHCNAFREIRNVRTPARLTPLYYDHVSTHGLSSFLQSWLRDQMIRRGSWRRQGSAAPPSPGRASAVTFPLARSPLPPELSRPP